MRILTFSFIVLGFLCTACKKDEPAKPDIPIDFSVTNSWECTIDGVQYSGSIDTSFIELIPNLAGAPDTMIYCTGTSSNKKANIHFGLRINRTGWGHDSLITQGGQNEFNFDTSSSNHLRAWANLGGITFHIEGLNATKFKGNFSGNAFALLGGGDRVVTNGKFSFDIGKGSNEPKFLSCNSDNIPIRGYVSAANLISNTLIIDGLGFHADSTFQLMIRTGSHLNPGVFKSRNGDVGFQAFRPSIVTNFVSDAIGDLTVTIQSVSGNIVEGTFSGVSNGAFTGSHANIINGKFRCRVRNYISQSDSTNKWGFSESNGLQWPYHTWGGNILNAKLSQIGIWNYLTINGESDNGKSKFKLKLSSTSPITTGLYESGLHPTFNVDSIYFFSSPYGGTYYQPFAEGIACQLDSIDNQRVVGHFYGTINYRTDPNSAFSTQPSLRRGYFTANF